MIRTLRRMTAIAVKEVKHLMRDRLTIGMIAGIPLMQLLLFGYAINTDVRQLAAAVADEANSQYSRNLVAAAEATQIIAIRQRVSTAGELEDLLRRGEINVGIYLPPDVERRAQQPDRPLGQLLVNGADPTVLRAVEPLTALRHPDQVSPGTPAGLALRAFYNPERRSEIFIVPGLIGVILTMTMMLFTATSIVREREHGNLEFLITMPVSTVELMAAKVLPYIVIGMVQVSLILGLGLLMFDVPIRGSLADLYLASLVFVSACLSLGLLISTLVSTQFQAMQMTMFLFLPSVLLSGFMFPFDAMPVAAQWIAQILPLTHFTRLVQGIVLRGASAWELRGEILVLIGFTVLMMALAVVRFRKRLD